MSSLRRGLTLIELLIAMGILFMLIAMMATIYTRSSNVAISSLALLQLYHKQEAINRMLERDLEAVLPHAALILEPGRSLTTMAARRRDPTQDGHYFTLEPWRGRDLEWVRYEWDASSGVLTRGGSRPPEDWNAQDIDNSWQLRNAIDTMGIHPTAQRSARYLLGAGTLGTGPGIQVAPGGRQTIHDGLDGAGGSNGGIDHRFAGADAREQLRVHAMLGDVRPVAGVHAVVNPDGQSVNKDWANLVGSSDLAAPYPTQLAPLAERVELFEITLRKRDGSRISAIDDADTLEDGATSIDLRGLRLDHRQDADLDLRPAVAVVRYLLHDVPPKDVGSDGSTPLIEELRAQVLADPELADPDPVIAGERRRRALRDAIIRWKRHAILVTKSVRLPL
jgi:type II secretory pathway component PulJ